MKWFRFWTDTVNDVKMLQLSDYEYRIWTYLLAYASEVNSLSGELQITFKLLSLHFHQRFNLFSRAIETFQKVGLITISNEGYITITNWTKRQFKSDNAYERVKKFREVTAKRNVSNPVSETAPDKDTDKDTDKPPIPPKKRGDEYDPNFLIFWSHYPKKSKKPNAYQEWKKLGKKRPNLEHIIECVEKQKSWRTWIEGFIPDPERWLKNERWMDEEPPKGGNGDGKRDNQRTGAPYSYARRGQAEQGGLGLPSEYKSEAPPVISEEERQRNLERIKEFTR